MTSNQLTERLLIIMSYFFIFGETTAQKLASDLSVSDEISIYNSLNSLSKIGFVTRCKPNPNRSIYSIYYLSKEGLEYIETVLK